MKVTKEQSEEGRKLLEDLEKKLKDPEKPPLQVSQPDKWGYGPGNEAIVPGANYEIDNEPDVPDSGKAGSESGDKESKDPAKKA